MSGDFHELQEVERAAVHPGQHRGQCECYQLAASVFSSICCPGWLPAVSPASDLMGLEGHGFRGLGLNTLNMAFPAQEWLRMSPWLEMGRKRVWRTVVL